jgi:hypothetical protein
MHAVNPGPWRIKRPLGWHPQARRQILLSLDDERIAVFAYAGVSVVRAGK